ncbi:MAG: amidohydrolase [Ruminiclostridium sp.]|nr:amidohydrolase [Ruminiclostridium sp.]
MKIIDAHIHFSNIESFKQTARDLSFLDYSKAGFMKQFREANVMLAIGMGLSEQAPDGFPDQTSPNPMLLDLEDMPGGIVLCPGINPLNLQSAAVEELKRIEAMLSAPNTVGIKIYAGYYPFYVHDEVYEPIYRLAEEYNLAIVIHGGATYSDRCCLKHSHPLEVDQLAVRHRHLNFIIAHMGDPWVMDTAVVVSKNENVFADLSGLIVGDEQKIWKNRTNRLMLDHFKQALDYAERYDKFLFGSDWPLAPVMPYIEFVRDLIPEEYHANVFYQNALRAFPKLKNLIG